MTRFVAMDLETTSTEVSTAVAVQAALVVSHDLRSLSGAQEHVTLCKAKAIPAAASRVHGIYVEDGSMVQRDHDGSEVAREDSPKPFSTYVKPLVANMTRPGTVLVTFNGAGYDVPVVARYEAKRQRRAEQVPVSQAVLERRLNAQHADVYRLWRRLQIRDRVADCYKGSLSGAHFYFFRELFDGAHDAAIDCRATLRTFGEMLARELYSVDEAIRLSKLPLPGDVDFSGKFKWDGDACCVGFGKHRGTPIEDMPASYLDWMLKQDFPADTCTLIAAFKRGTYPQRDETT